MEILKKHQFFFMLLFALTACEKDATVKLPKVESKLVIMSFISPQDALVKVSVTLTQPLYNTVAQNHYEQVKDAEVVISSALGSQTLTFNPTLNYFVADSSDLKIREGYTYKLSVSTADGKKITSSTIIPPQTQNVNYVLKADSFEQSLQITWADFPSTTDYYRLLVRYDSYFLYEGNKDTITFSDTIKFSTMDGEFIEDLVNPGGTLTKNLYVVIGNGNPDTVYPILKHVSKEYYDYHQKLYKTQNSNGPFSEPVPMYTNITNGLGIFAGFNQYKIKVFR